MNATRTWAAMSHCHAAATLRNTAMPRTTNIVNRYNCILHCVTQIATPNKQPPYMWLLLLPLPPPLLLRLLF
jgi:hypothetical protein